MMAGEGGFGLTPVPSWARDGAARGRRHRRMPCYMKKKTPSTTCTFLGGHHPNALKTHAVKQSLMRQEKLGTDIGQANKLAKKITNHAAALVS